MSSFPNPGPNSGPNLGEPVLNLIAGEWQPALTGKWTERRDPADQTVLVAKAPDSGREDSQRAIAAAAKARAGWEALPPPKRGQILFEWLKWIDQNKERLAYLLTRE